MADRKQTPDILTEIMGGTTPTSSDKLVEVKKAPAQKPASSSKRVSKPSASQRSNRGITWEYKLVSFQDYKGCRPRFVNGIEINDWMNAPLIHEYLNQLAEEGWELSAANSGQRLYGLSDSRQLYFRRPRSNK